MKKTLLSLAVLASSLLPASAQTMIAYGVDTSTSPMELITDGTKVPVDYTGSEFSKLVITGDGESNFNEVEKGTTGFPIGFNFTFDSKEMTQFYIGTDGIIFLADKDGRAISAQENAFFAFNGDDDDDLGVVSIGGMFGLDNTEISYKNYEEDGQKVLLIQYKNIGIADRWCENAVATANLQYRLYANGNIQIKVSGFKPYDDANCSNLSLKTGIHGASDDRLLIASWDGSQTSADDQRIRYDETSYPADGTTYTFTAPEPCSTPNAQPSALQLDATSESVSGTFSTIDDADHYLVVVSKDDALNTVPVDKTYYHVGDSIGNGLVVADAVEGSFNSYDESSWKPLLLTPSANYNVTVFSYNSRCLNGPLYNTTAPLSGSIKTMPSAPEMSVTSVDSTTITLQAEPAEGMQVMVLYSDSVRTNSLGQKYNYGTFGTPTGILAVGDSVQGGGVVAYIGGASKNIKVNGLTPGKTYFFRALNADGQGHYSSLCADDLANTSQKVTYVADFTNASASHDIPYGWKGVGEWSYNSNPVYGGGLVNTIDNADETNGIVQTATSPSIYLGNKVNRVKTTWRLWQYMAGSYHRSENFLSADGDTLALQVSDDGVNYKNLKVFTKSNGYAFTDADTEVKVSSEFSDFANKKVNFRIYLRSYEASTLVVEDFMVEQKPDCDYPVNVSTNNINGGNVTLTWDLNGEEGTWEYSYKKSDDDTWSEPVMTNSKTATLEGLDALTNYDFRVRTVCDATHHSDWSTTYTFKTGLVVPFVENIANEEESPEGWESYDGKLATPTMLESSYSFMFMPDYGDGACVYLNSYYDQCNAWFVSPQFTLANDKTKGVVVSMDMVMGSASYYGTPATDQKIYLVLSRDGEHFNEADTVCVLNQADFPEANESLTLTSDTIKGYSGPSRLGIYTSTTDGVATSFKIKSVSVCYVDLPATDGIRSMTVDTADSDEVIARYNSAGQLIDHPQSGINILRMKDGSIRKVLVK